MTEMVFRLFFMPSSMMKIHIIHYICGDFRLNVATITTKRGEAFSDVATTRVEYDGYVSASVRNGDMGMATAEEFRNLGALSNGAISPVIQSENNTDWVGALCRDASMAHNVYVAIVGFSSIFIYS